MNSCAPQVQQARELLDCPLRDRDGIFGQEFREQVQNMGITEVLSAPPPPWQREYVERVIGSIRRECLEHVIVFDERSLRRILASYVDQDHELPNSDSAHTLESLRHI